MKANNDTKKYEDIIHLPHHVSTKRPQMAIRDRAAQFSPFSAVVGHESAVKEAARHTDHKRELDETKKSRIDISLRDIEAHLPDLCEVEVVYYEADPLKSGGTYIEKLVKIQKIDPYSKEVHMLDGTRIAISDLYSITNNALNSYK